MLLVSNLKLNESLKLAYSTSEILLHRSLGEEKILMLYGKAGTQAELVLEANGADVQFTLPQGVELVDTADNRYAFVYQYEGLKSILVETEGEATYRIVIVTTDMAGRTWAHHDDQGDALTIGLDYVLYQRGESGSLSANYEQ